MKKIIIDIVMVLLGIAFLGMIFSNTIKNKMISHKSEEKYSQIKTISKEDIKENEKKKGNFDLTSVNFVNDDNLLQMAMSRADEYTYHTTGFVSVPSVGIRLPIFLGVSDLNLINGAGTTTEGEGMGKGNYGLASHHINDPSALFAPLTKVQEGEKILTTNKESIYEYTINEILIVSPYRGDLLDRVEGKTLITLITCSDLQGTKRLVVRGELSNEWTVDKAPESAKNSLGI